MKPLLATVTAALIVVGCQRRQESACEELRQQVPDTPLADEEKRCAELLAFGSTLPDRYGMDFAEWVDTVPAQRARFTLDAIYALTERQSWHPSSFGPSPPQIPCGGLAVTDELWHAETLSQIVTTRPDRIFVSLNIEIVDDRAAIRVHQDFDCDGELGLMEVVGLFKRGISPFAGGWTALSATAPDIEE